ncbi:MAG TPA: hypothetical protein VGO72_03785, partial [Herminiimonas sp.]|nr:hypothetical protein [Herminiimonas sp.]
AAFAAEQRRETPGPSQLAKKFGQNKPRPGGAVVRTPSKNASAARPPMSGKPRKGITSVAKAGRK